MAAGKIYIGTSGYHYSHWEKGVFYPSNLPKSKKLEYYIRFFDTVELNVTFYRLPQEKAFLSWYKRTPTHFLFAIKGSRFITHIKRLKEPHESLTRFFDRATKLREKLGVVLWQMPPAHKSNLERLRNFCEALTPWLQYRHAFEFRHPSWFNPEIYQLVKSFNMSVCHVDWPGLKVEVPTDFSFIYLRRHGPPEERLYTGCYSPKDIQRDADFVKKQAEQGKDVFVYFNNDAFGHAVRNALALKKLVGL
ncbi:MAG: DUF72 domain-containing protein [Candidatus Desulfofervidaceae bacterium]|nr:DUF72 domain-containing protein [Candidatus Desulfofervidaceae bacterium]